MNLGFAHFYKRGYAAVDDSFTVALEAAHGIPDAVAAFGHQVRQYIALWRFLSAAQNGSEYSLEDRAAGFDLSAWPGPIIRFYQDQMSVEEVLEAARSDPLQTEEEGLCEAHYYIGQHFLLNGETERAAQHFAATLATNDFYCFEYGFAAAELELIGAD